MQLINETPLVVGWVVGKLRPPQWAATFIVKGTFALQPDAALEWADEPKPLSGDVYAEDDLGKALLYSSDFAPFKPRADLLVRAVAHAPGGEPATAFPISIRAGQLTKQLTVFGERKWLRARGEVHDVTEPEPFVTLPIGYESAFGGPDYLPNPLGVGREMGRAPRIDHPNRPVRGPDDAAEPAGLSPIAGAWPARAAHLGSYDEDWLKTRWPWFPADFDWSYFNAAPADQQLQGYFSGDEELEFQNLHPEAADLRVSLPGYRPRCFVADTTFAGEEQFREVPLQLDTIFADLTSNALVLVWRGHLPVRTIKLTEVERIVLGVEALAEEPQPLDSYRAMRVRAEEEEPADPPDPDAGWEVAFDARLAQMDQRMAAQEREFAALESEMAALQKEADVAASAFRQQAAVTAPGAPVPVAAELAAVASFDKALAELRTGNPAAAAAAELHRPWIANAERQLAALDGEMKQMHDELAAQSAELEADRPRQWTRELVQQAAAAAESLSGQNLAGLDLSGLSLQQLDLHGAILAGTNLSGCQLAACDMREADLSGADLSGALLDFARLDGADLTGGKVAGASFRGISLSGATLTSLDLAGADLTACVAEKADFSAANLARSKLDGAKLNQADFTGANLEDAQLAGAALQAAQLEGVKAQGVNFEGADLSGVHGSGGSQFARGNFRNVAAAGSVFATANLDAADFSGANLARAQFGDASLCAAKFVGADLRGALFDDANLHTASLLYANAMGAGFDRANLGAADCRCANFFEAGFWDTLIEDADFSDANLTGTLLRDDAWKKV